MATQRVISPLGHSTGVNVICDSSDAGCQFPPTAAVRADPAFPSPNERLSNEQGPPTAQVAVCRSLPHLITSRYKYIVTRRRCLPGESGEVWHRCCTHERQGTGSCWGAELICKIPARQNAYLTKHEIKPGFEGPSCQRWLGHKTPTSSTLDA